MLIDVEHMDFSVKQAALRWEDGEYKVDWQWFTEFSQLTWDELLETQPTVPMLFRVVARKDNYYNYEFSDEEKLDCYRLYNSDDTHQVYGYVPKGTPLAAYMAKAFEKRLGVDSNQVQIMDTVRCILRLRFPENAKGGKQVEIVDFLQKDWESP